jgi:hypothetical protein
MDTWNFHDVNGALMVLLPKTTEASVIKDFHPISLIHIVGKLFSKVLVNRLMPKLANLVHPSQSAFIKHRFIQDNFKFVQASAKLLHARKWSSLLLKIDIACDFDLVAWSFLLKII